MENQGKTTNKNGCEMINLLNMTSSESDNASPSFTPFQANKPKRKVRFKKNFRPNSKLKGTSTSKNGNCNCSLVDCAKLFGCLLLLALVGILMWYVVSLSIRVQELQAKFTDIEAGNRNTPEALHSIHSKLRQLDNNVTALFHDIRKISSDIVNITSEVKLLKETTSNLQASIASAPAIQQLPKDVHTLSESVAAFGSKITTYDSTMKDMKEAQASYQTTTQTLSSELESLKTSVQELLNISDAGTRTSNSHFSGDVNVQKSMQETNESLSLMKKELSEFAKSVDVVRSDMKTYQNSFREVQEALSKNHDSIEYLENSTQQHTMRITALENLIQNNLLGRILALESQKISEMGSSTLSPELLAVIQQNINSSVFEVLFHVLNISQADGQSLRNQSQIVKQVHNILILISGLLKQFSGLPDADLLDSKNASEVMEVMLNKTLTELMEKCESKFEKKWTTLYGLTEPGNYYTSQSTVAKVHPEETPNTRDTSVTVPTARIQSASAKPASDDGNISVAKN